MGKNTKKELNADKINGVFNTRAKLASHLFNDSVWIIVGIIILISENYISPETTFNTIATILGIASILIGIIKLTRPLGLKFDGILFCEDGIEIGTLYERKIRKEWKNDYRGKLVNPIWTLRHKIINETITFLIKIKQIEETKYYFREIQLYSKDKRKYNIINRRIFENSVTKLENDIAIIVNGNFELLGGLKNELSYKELLTPIEIFKNFMNILSNGARGQVTLDFLSKDVHYQTLDFLGFVGGIIGIMKNKEIQEEFNEQANAGTIFDVQYANKLSTILKENNWNIQFNNKELTLSLDVLPKTIECPNCKQELELDEEERKLKQFTCPECEKFIDLT